MSKPTINKHIMELMLSHDDETLVAMLLDSGRIPPDGKQFWLELMPRLRASRPEEGKSESYRNALSHAAYALFQIKRMVGVPHHVIDFVRSEHAKACAVLDGDAGTPPQNGGDSNG
jgi:hypothetical protein